MLPAVVVLALAPARIPLAVLDGTRQALCAATAMFLLAADMHRFGNQIQKRVDPSGHLLVYGCGMIATLPLVQWALTKMRQPPVSRSRLQ